MKLFILITTNILLLATVALAKDNKLSNQPSIKHGRYIARTSGCNDCHTPMYMPQNGNVEEKEWLSGSTIGWMGPWGTTYASNLRQRAAGMSEDQWVVYLKNLKTRPPMPFFAVNDMSEYDTRSLYLFLRSLGNHAQIIPSALPPGKKPNTPYFDFNLILPGNKSASLKP